MPVPEGWQINPDWPSDTSGIVGYFYDAKASTANKTLFDVGGWRFFLSGEGDVKCYPFKSGIVLVVLSNLCFLVDESHRRVTLPDLNAADLDSITYVESHDMIVAVADWGGSVVALGSSGVIWRNKSSYLHDIQSFGVAGGVVKITVWRDYDQSPVSLEMSLDTGEELMSR